VDLLYGTDNVCLIQFKAYSHQFKKHHRLRQPLSRHGRRQLAVLPLNHCGAVAHLLAQRVDVRAVAQQFDRGAGCTEFVSAPVRSSPILSHASAF